MLYLVTNKKGDKGVRRIGKRKEWAADKSGPVAEEGVRGLQTRVRKNTQKRKRLRRKGKKKTKNRLYIKKNVSTNWSAIKSHKG